MLDNVDRFDHLIALAAMECTRDEASKFRELDTSSVSFDDDYYKKRRKMINKCRRRPAFNLSRAAAIKIAAALAIMITLTAIMIGCVPGLRHAIQKAIVEWYNEYFTVRYEDPSGDGMETGYEEHTTGEAIQNAPTYIKNIRKPTNLPEGIIEDIVTETSTQIIIDYYVADEYLCSFAQSVLKSNNKYIDTEAANIQHIQINGNDAAVIEYQSQNEMYVFWSDGEYSYHLVSTECSVEMLIKYAESVK